MYVLCVEYPSLLQYMCRRKLRRAAGKKRIPRSVSIASSRDGGLLPGVRRGERLRGRPSGVVAILAASSYFARPGCEDRTWYTESQTPRTGWNRRPLQGKGCEHCNITERKEESSGRDSSGLKLICHEYIKAMEHERFQRVRMGWHVSKRKRSRR